MTSTPVSNATPSVSVATQVEAVPSVTIAASPAKVRSVIAQRALARGTKVLVNDDRGVVLERALAETTPVLAGQCGPHVPGRVVQVILTTTPSGDGTNVSEKRYIVDGDKICSVRLTPAEVDQAQQGLKQIEAQARV